MLRGTQGPSGTAIAVASFRAAYTCAPAPIAVVDDPFARRLIPRPLGRLVGITKSRPRLGWALHRTLAVLSAEMSTNLALRTAAIDDAIRSALSRGVRQLVVLGSGLDARAWRMPELAPCSVFELDRQGAHRIKQRRLDGLPGRPRRHRLVPIDFEHETLADVLLPAGFDASQPTFWLWEAVAIYLTPAAIEGTLSALAALSSSESTLVADLETAPWSRTSLGRAPETGLPIRACHIRRTAAVLNSRSNNSSKTPRSKERRRNR